MSWDFNRGLPPYSSGGKRIPDRKVAGWIVRVHLQSWCIALEKSWPTSFTGSRQPVVNITGNADSTYPSVSCFTKHSKSLIHPGFEASGRMTIPSLLTAEERFSSRSLKHVKIQDSQSERIYIRQKSHVSLSLSAYLIDSLVLCFKKNLNKKYLHFHLSVIWSPTAPKKMNIHPPKTPTWQWGEKKKETQPCIKMKMYLPSSPKKWRFFLKIIFLYWRVSSFPSQPLWSQLASKGQFHFGPRFRSIIQVCKDRSEGPDPNGRSWPEKTCITSRGVAGSSKYPGLWGSRIVSMKKRHVLGFLRWYHPCMPPIGRSRYVYM